MEQNSLNSLFIIIHLLIWSFLLLQCLQQTDIVPVSSYKQQTLGVPYVLDDGLWRLLNHKEDRDRSRSSGECRLLILFPLVLSEHMLTDVIYSNNNKRVRQMETDWIFYLSHGDLSSSSQSLGKKYANLQRTPLLQLSQHTNSLSSLCLYSCLPGFLTFAAFSVESRLNCCCFVIDGWWGLTSKCHTFPRTQWIANLSAGVPLFNDRGLLTLIRETC